VLSVASARILSSLGVWSELVGGASPIRKVHVSSRGQLGIVRFDAADYGLDALGFSVNLSAILAALDSKVAASSSVCRFFSSEVVSAVRQPEGVCLSVVDGSGQSSQLSGRLVVAADGVHSGVRSFAGVEAVKFPEAVCALVAQVGLRQCHEGQAFERFTEFGPLALLPFGERRVSLVLCVDNGSVGSLVGLSDAERLGFVQEQFGFRLGRFVDVSSFSQFPVLQQFVSEVAVPGFVFVGNAANSLHPNAAQGLNLGLRDVAALADVLRSCGQSFVVEDVVDLYLKQRSVDHRVIRHFTAQLGPLFAVDFLPFRAVRNLSQLVFDALPGAKRSFVRWATGQHAYG